MNRQRGIFIAAIVLALGYAWLRGGFVRFGADLEGRPLQQSVESRPVQQPRDGRATQQQPTATATFAAGCFWCVEADFDKVPGVISTTSGYIGGRVKDPSYEQVSRGGTGHTEAVEIVYDPGKVSYTQLLDHFWKNVDPLNAHRQFCDVGDQYRPAIFVHDPAQREAAEASKARVQQRFKDPVVVQVIDAAPFYRAEGYHQDYYKKNPVQYRYYRWSCGRDARLKDLWGKSS
jgi:peptide-methionine (S)-S-oxide reductase